MRTARFGAVLLLVASSAAAQAPEPDIYLVNISRPGGRITVDGVRNLTERPGYDNQPAWSRDGSTIYYTSVRDDAQADIYRVPASGGAAERVTRTAPESEYSATFIPGLNAISVVRVERDSAQRLWSVPLNGAPSQVILENIKPVGYHTWVDATTLALFVLGSPNTLQLASTGTGKADTIVTNVGRSLHTREGQVSFVHKVSRDEWWLVLLDPGTRAMRRLIQMPPRVEDYDWTPQGDVLIGDGSTLKVFRPGGAPEWRTVFDFKDLGITGITRLAVSPKGDAIAMVAVPGSKPGS